MLRPFCGLPASNTKIEVVTPTPKNRFSGSFIMVVNVLLFSILLPYFLSAPSFSNLRGVKRNAINRVVRKNDNDFDN